MADDVVYLPARDPKAKGATSTGGACCCPADAFGIEDIEVAERTAAAAPHQLGGGGVEDRSMRLVALARAPDGVRLAYDVRSRDEASMPLLRAGTSLSRRYSRRLAEIGVRAVWLHDEDVVGVSALPPLDEAARAEVERRVVRVMAEAAQGIRRGLPVSGAVVRRLGAIARSIAERLSATPEAAYAFMDLAGADAYTHRHSLNVTVLGLMLADRHWRRWGWLDWQGQRRHDRHDERLVKLGFGLLVHDLGKLAVPPEILHKPGALDAGEWAVMRRHPELGVAMLEPADVSPLSLDVVRSHHERLDGSGYPRGLVGGQVHEFARIAAIVDTYDAIVSDRVYQAGRPRHIALNILAADTPDKYDPDLFETFGTIAVPFPVGTEIPLPNGGSGVVVDVDVDDPWILTARIPQGRQVPVDLTHLDARRALASRV